MLSLKPMEALKHDGSSFSSLESLSRLARLTNPHLLLKFQKYLFKCLVSVPIIIFDFQQ